MDWGTGCESLGGLNPGHMWGGGMGIFGPLLGLLLLLGFLALLVASVIWVIRRSSRATSGAGVYGGSTAALDVVQNRLASGEITVEEYHRIRDELKG